MAINENKRRAIKAVAAVAAVAVLWSSAFSVSAKTNSNEGSTTTETQVSGSEEIILPDGDALRSNGEIGMNVVEGVTVDIKVGTQDYKSYDVPKSTVKDALDHANITLGEDDTVNKSLKAKVTNKTKIKVNRVSYKKKVKTEKISYKTVTKDTVSLYAGQKKVAQKGVNGKKKVTYTKKIVNGKVKKVVVTNTKVVKKAKKKVVLVGTKRKNYWMIANNPTSFNTKSSGGAGTILDHNGKKIAYKKVFSGSSTAYYAPAGAGTSIGDTVHIGGVAVNPNMIPYGSKLYIESPDGSFVYGYAVANDTGGFAYTGAALVDCFYPTYDMCVQFGRRNLNVYVLA